MDFPKISKEDWKAKIEAELKGKKSMEDLSYKIGEEIEIDILLQEEDRIENVSLEIPENPTYGIYFEGIPENKMILEALKRGASTLYLKGSPRQEWKEYMKGVTAEFIDLYVNDVRQSDEYDFLYEDKTYELKPERILDITNSVDNSNLVASIDHLSNNDGNLGIVLNDAFVLNIAIIRSLRGLFQRNGINGKILSFISRKNESFENQLIRYTTQAIAAVTGGSDHTFFPIHENCKNEDVSKIIHIANVLIMESRLKRYKDPWRGSYVIERMTRSIIDKVKGGH